MITAQDIEGLLAGPCVASSGSKNHFKNDMNSTTNSASVYNVEHMDYNYVANCNDLKELKTLLDVLRSGKEGSYQNLENCIETRIQGLGGIGPQDFVGSSAIAGQELDHIKYDIHDWLDRLSLSTQQILKMGIVGDKDKTACSMDREQIEASAIEFNMKGHEALLSEDFDEAIAHYSEAMVLSPKEPKYLSNCAIACIKQGNYEQAAICAQDALKLSPSLGLAYKSFFRLAHARHYQSKWKECSEALDQCINLSFHLESVSDHVYLMKRNTSKWRDMDSNSFLEGETLNVFCINNYP